MRKLFLSLLLALCILAPFSGSVTSVRAEKIEEVSLGRDKNGNPTRVEKNCYWDKDTKGILVDYKVVQGTAPGSEKVFTCYLRVFLAGNSALIVTVAVIIVVFSGIQYMLALGNSGTQAKAKQRVVSVLTGVVFLTLIRFFLTIIKG